MRIPTTADLPADQQRRLHEDFIANEQAYWQARNDLLEHYRDQWVAFHNGKVIAAGKNLLAITEAGTGHPFVALVGKEEVVFRLRNPGRWQHFFSGDS